MDKNSLEKLELQLNTILQKEITIEYLHGYLSAVVSAPELIMPSHWIDLLLANEEEIPAYQSTEHATQVMQGIMQFFNEIEESIHDKNYAPLFSADLLAPTPEIAKDWTKGFILGLNLWDKAILEDRVVTQLLMPIVVIFDIDEFIHPLTANEKKLFTAEKILELQTNALLRIAPNIISLREHFQKITNKKNKPNSEAAINQDRIKVGRNEKCPCGSQKKYKQCCGK